ncbi:MAG: nuclease [Geobacter sp.]|nr:nuclease [Geobacter sp.]
MRVTLAIGILLSLFYSDAFAGRAVDGIVKAVYDGDTILLATREESRLKIRLYGIDAPETTKPDAPGQPFGAIAKRTLMYKVMGRQVLAEIVDIDKYQRAVAIIRYNGRDINREMVSEGMAWAYRQYLQGAYASEYIEEESRARSHRRGLWREPNPRPPWDYRKSVMKAGRMRSR